MRKMWMSASLVVLALVFCARAEDTKQDASKIVGTWKITNQESDGKRAAATDLKDKEVKITKDSITCSGKDGMSCTYEVDTTATPWKITMKCTDGEHKGKTLKGIAKLDGDNLSVCFAKPDGETPTKFEAKEKQCCMTLKRAEK